jgi:hypothetical protein
MQMIHWEIIVNPGKWAVHPEGYIPGKDGCVFPDWQYQTLLLPHFHTGAIIVDEYDGAVFEGKQLDHLERNLQWALERYWGLENRTWQVTTLFEAFSDFKESSQKEEFSGKQICDLLEKTLEMIKRAKNLNAAIAFFGD